MTIIALPITIKVHLLWFKHNLHIYMGGGGDGNTRMVRGGRGPIWIVRWV